MRKDILTKRHETLLARKEELAKRAQASNDVEEVRSITDQLKTLNEDIDFIAAEIAEIEANERAASGMPGAAVPEGATLVNGHVKGQYAAAQSEKRDEEPTASVEYRSAFKAYVQGKEVPKEYREAITTAETGAAVPVTVMREVINTVRKRYGNLYNKVRKTNLQGGIQYPVGSLGATFKWITEETVSPRQKFNALAKVTFGYNTAEIRIAQSFLSNIVTLTEFEATISQAIAIAYLQAMDIGIVKGTGNGQMLGILNDSRVTNYVEMTAADFNNWTAWRKKFFSKLELGYRGGEFIFPLSTVEMYLETMADANNNPIFRQATGLEVNDGDARNPGGRFFGRDISLVEPDVLPDFDDANVGDVIGIFWQPEEYAINENFGFMMRRYFDEETNEWVNKALTVVDGKVLNPNGYWLIKKKAST